MLSCPSLYVETVNKRENHVYSTTIFIGTSNLCQMFTNKTLKSHLDSKPMFTHMRLATCDVQHATFLLQILFLILFTHLRRATCDMRQRQIRPCSDFVACRMRGDGWKMGGNQGMGEKLRIKSIFLYNVCCSSNHRIALICSVDCCKMYYHYIS